MSTRDLPVFTAPNRTRALQLNFQPRIIRRDLHVVGVETLTPGYRRIHLSGDDLADGFPYGRFAPGDHVKVFFPDPVTGELSSYRDLGDEWVQEGEADPIPRDYTIRAWDAATRRLSLDFVLHDHGVAGRWARTAQVGDRVVVNGPSANQFLPETYAHYLAIGDETALPAVARIIEEAPTDASVTAIVELRDARHEQPLTRDGALDLRWVHRDPSAAVDGVGALEAAVRALALPSPLDDLYVFAAGEAGAMKPIRRYFRRELGMAKQQLEVDGYWKRGITEFDHHEADIPED